MYIFILQFLRCVTEKLLWPRFAHTARITCALIQTKPAWLPRTDNLYQLGI